MASLRQRGKSYQIQYYANGKQKRIGLGEIPLQLAKEKLRQFESAQARGDDNPLPTRTPIPDIVAAYVEHIRTVKTAKSAQTDIYYLREMFGPVCDAVKVTSRRVGEATRKRPLSEPNRRHGATVIEGRYLEEISTAQIASFVTTHVRRRALAPKTANRYREVIHRLFNWAMTQQGVRLPNGRNPANAVERFHEPAPQIRYLTLEQIDQQLAALEECPQLQAMVATLVYAGLRREELLWLQREDVALHSSPPILRVRAKTFDGASWQPKTKRSRAVPIAQDLRRYLDQYAPRPSRGDWYFPSPQGARWDPDNFSADLRKANAAAHLNWTCLHYRHTFGSQLAQRGLSLFQIAHLMGNSPEICRRHYAALSVSALAEKVSFSAITRFGARNAEEGAG